MLRISVLDVADRSSVLLDQGGNAIIAFAGKADWPSYARTAAISLSVVAASLAPKETRFRLNCLIPAPLPIPW
jgi:hypothetical protein